MGTHAGPVCRGRKKSNNNVNMLMQCCVMCFSVVAAKRVAVTENTSAILKWCCTHEKDKNTKMVD